MPPSNEIRHRTVTMSGEVPKLSTASTTQAVHQLADMDYTILSEIQPLAHQVQSCAWKNVMGKIGYLPMTLCHSQKWTWCTSLADMNSKYALAEQIVRTKMT